MNNQKQELPSWALPLEEPPSLWSVVLKSITFKSFLKSLFLALIIAATMAISTTVYSVPAYFMAFPLACLLRALPRRSFWRYY